MVERSVGCWQGLCGCARAVGGRHPDQGGRVAAKVSEEQKWHGVVGDITGCSLDLRHVPFKNGLDTFVEAGHVGAQPWLAAMKKNMRRHGPTAVTSPGVLMLIVPRKSVFVHYYPCESLCEKRHPVVNYENYVATPTFAST